MTYVLDEVIDETDLPMKERRSVSVLKESMLLDSASRAAMQRSASRKGTTLVATLPEIETESSNFSE